MTIIYESVSIVIGLFLVIWRDLRSCDILTTSGRPDNTELRAEPFIPCYVANIDRRATDQKRQRQ
jgi:hypothetical protein